LEAQASFARLAKDRSGLAVRALVHHLSLEESGADSEVEALAAAARSLRAAGDPASAAFALSWLAEHCFRIDDLLRAADYLAQAERLWTRIGDGYRAGTALAFRAAALAQSGRISLAETHFARAEEQIVAGDGEISKTLKIAFALAEQEA